MRPLVWIIAVLLLAAAPLQAADTPAYDEGWYRAPFWSGEYPRGFSMARTATVPLRPVADLEAERSIACELPQGGTYQPWNRPRVEAQALHFVSYTRIAEYRMTDDLDTTVYRHDDGTEVALSLKDGEEWRFLVYLSEGAFLMEHEGVLYDAYQDVVEHAQQKGDLNGYHEWLRINCDNNQWGWLFMGDITLDDGVFLSPNITGYGEAEDIR